MQSSRLYLVFLSTQKTEKPQLKLHEIDWKTTTQTSRNYLYMLPVAVALTTMQHLTYFRFGRCLHIPGNLSPLMLANALVHRMRCGGIMHCWMLSSTPLKADECILWGVTGQSVLSPTALFGSYNLIIQVEVQTEYQETSLVDNRISKQAAVVQW